MSVPSLLASCIKTLAQDDLEELLQKVIEFDNALQQKIFDAVFGIVEVYMDTSKLRIRKANLLPMTMKSWMVSKLRQFNLQSLKIECTLWEYKCRERPAYYRILQLLKGCLNGDSRQSLQHLTIVSGRKFQRNWFGILLVMLPNLQTLVRKGIASSVFPQAFYPYVSLRCLDISNSTMRTVRGISLLPSLETLIIRNVEFENVEDFEELFLLHNLKVLDVSRSFPLADPTKCRVIYFLVANRNSLPNLAYIDCANLHVTYQRLAMLLSLNPTLKTICLFGTGCQDISHPDVEVLSAATLPDAMNLVDHYDRLERYSMVYTVFRATKEIWKKIGSYSDNQEILDECFHKLLEFARKSRGFESATLRSSAVKLLLKFCRKFIRDLGSKKTQFVLSYLMNDYHHVLHYIQDEIFWIFFGILDIGSVPNADISSVVGTATRCLLNDDYDVTHYSESEEFARKVITVVQSLCKLLNWMPREALSKLQHIQKAFGTLSELIKIEYSKFKQTQGMGHHYKIDLLANTMIAIVQRSKLDFGCAIVTSQISAMCESGHDDWVNTRCLDIAESMIERWTWYDVMNAHIRSDTVHNIIKAVHIPFNHTTHSYNETTKRNAVRVMKLLALLVKPSDLRGAEGRYLEVFTSISSVPEVARRLVFDIDWSTETMSFEEEPTAKEWAKETLRNLYAMIEYFEGQYERCSDENKNLFGVHVCLNWRGELME